MKQKIASTLPGLLVVAVSLVTSFVFRGHVSMWGVDVVDRLAVLAALSIPLAFVGNGTTKVARGIVAALFGGAVSVCLVEPYAANYWPGLTGVCASTAIALALAAYSFHATSFVDGGIWHRALFSFTAVGAGCAFFAAGNILLAANMACLGGVALIWRVSRPGPFIGYYAILVLFAALFGGVNSYLALALVALPFISGLGGKGMGVKVMVSAAALTLFVGAGCRPLKPSGGKRVENVAPIPLDDATGTVGFSFADDAFRLLAEPPTSLRVRVCQVINEHMGPQEGDDAIFPITEDVHTYHVDGVKLGMKDFGVALLNARGEVIGEGHAHWLVKPGAQVLDQPIDITVREPSRQRRNVNLDVYVQTTAPGETPKSTYLDTKQIITDYCVGCHATTSQPQPGGGLVLESFPFKAIDLNTQDRIVREMVKSMRAVTWQMPPDPNPRVPSAKIDVIEKWANDGLPAVPGGSDDLTDLAASVICKWQMVDGGESGQTTIVRGTDPSHPFRVIWQGAVVDAKYNLTIEVHSRDGTVFATQVVASPQLVAATGDLAVTINVPYVAPTVDIPIVIHQ